jgi:hypothetical protein
VNIYELTSPTLINVVCNAGKTAATTTTIPKVNLLLLKLHPPLLKCGLVMVVNP